MTDLPHCYYQDGAWHAGYPGRPPMEFPFDVDPARIPTPLASVGERVRFYRGTARDKVWVGVVLEVFMYMKGIWDLDSEEEQKKRAEAHYYGAERMRYIIDTSVHDYSIAAKDVIGKV